MIFHKNIKITKITKIPYIIIVFFQQYDNDENDLLLDDHGSYIQYLLVCFYFYFLDLMIFHNILNVLKGSLEILIFISWKNCCSCGCESGGSY